MGRLSTEVEEFLRFCRGNIWNLCRALNFVPTWQQAEALALVQLETLLPPERRKKRIAIKSGKGPGKCGRADTNVFDLSTGRRQTLGQLAEREAEFRVLSMVPATEKLKACNARAFPSGQKPCVEVRTTSGQWIGVSTDHPIYTPHGWVNAEDLKPGDFVATPRILPPPEHPLVILDSEVRYIAYMMADGGTAGGSCVFTQMPGPVLDEMLEDVIALGGGLRVNRPRGKALSIGFTKMLPINRRWSIQNCKSTKKRVPDEFFGLDDRQLALFINRFWACDGYFTKDGPEMCLANRQLILDFQTLLLRFGILSRFSYKASKCEGKTFDSWRLRICGAENIERWRRSIGEVLGKERRLPAPKTNNTNVDVIPECSKLLQEVGISESDCRYIGHRLQSWSNWSRQKIQQVLQHFGKQHRRAENDLCWVKVSEVVPTGTHDVYDLEVPETGNFVANNLVIHNSTILEVINLFRCLQAMDALVILTAPSMRQCTDVGLVELSRLLDKADPLLQRMVKVMGKRVEICERKTWGIWTATASKEVNLQGYHHPFLTFVLEECAGISRPLITTAKTTLTNPDSLLVAIGNPNFRDCAFFDFFTREREQWHCLTWNAEDTARDYPHILDPGKNRLIELEYGRDSDVYRVSVLGEFPHSDPNCVLTIEMIERAVGTPMQVAARRTKVLRADKALGYDFARMGGDENVVIRRSGLAVVEWDHFAHQEPSTLVATGFKMQYEAGWRNDDCWHIIDVTGLGGGVAHLFHEGKKQVFEFNNGSKASNSQYADKITEGFFNLAHLLKTERVHLPDDNRLIQQLSTRQYRTNKKGQLIVETKQEYMDRGNDSPDRADAVIETYYDSLLAPTRVTAVERRAHRVGVRRTR